MSFDIKSYALLRRLRIINTRLILKIRSFKIATVKATFKKNNLAYFAFFRSHELWHLRLVSSLSIILYKKKIIKVPSFIKIQNVRQAAKKQIW